MSGLEFNRKLGSSINGIAHQYLDFLLAETTVCLPHESQNLQIVTNVVDKAQRTIKPDISCRSPNGFCNWDIWSKEQVRVICLA